MAIQCFNYEIPFDNQMLLELKPYETFWDFSFDSKTQLN